jgi:hypothetical protein
VAVVGAALLVLASFEAVFAVNLVRRLFFGSAMPNISGYAYFWRQDTLFAARDAAAMPVLWIPALLSVAAAVPAGWAIGTLHERHRVIAIALFTASVAACAVLNLGSPFAAQFATMVAFVVSLLAGGRLTAPEGHRPGRTT